MDKDDFWTLNRIEGHYGIKTTPIMEALHSGALTGFKVGQAILVELGDLRSWIRTQRLVGKENKIGNNSRASG